MPNICPISLIVFIKWRKTGAESKDGVGLGPGHRQTAVGFSWRRIGRREHTRCGQLFQILLPDR